MAFKIGEFSRLTGVPIVTLRYWDKKGKLVANRTLGGDRVYTEREVRQLYELMLESNKRNYKHYSEEQLNRVKSLLD